MEFNGVNKRLRITMMEKTKLEDDFMSSGHRNNLTKHAHAIANVALYNQDVLQLE